MISTRITAFFLAVVTVLPLLLVSVNSWATELDVELIESLTEEENDERDSENVDFVLSAHFTLDLVIVEIENMRTHLNKTSFTLDQSDWAYKVPTPPPELS